MKNIIDILAKPRTDLTSPELKTEKLFWEKIDKAQKRTELIKKLVGKGVKIKMGAKKLFRLSEEQFNLLKLLKKNNVGNSEIARLINSSTNSISVWNKYDNWADYCKYKESISKKQVEKYHKANGNEKLQSAVIIPKIELAQLGNCLTMASKIIVKYIGQ